LCFEHDQAHEFQAQFLHYLMFHMFNQAPRPFPDFI
jgi:hypothetical protein